MFIAQAAGSALALLAPFPARAADTIKAVRAWPAQDYTRLTIESPSALKYEMQILKGPDRLVLDLENVDYNGLQQELTGKLQADDPYIIGVRAGRFKANVVRIVLDLKTEVKPQIFQLRPVGEYEHRLVVDVYPINPPDPLIALLQKQDRQPSESATPAPESGPAPQQSPQAARPDAKTPSQ